MKSKEYARRRIEKLRREIDRYRYAYHVLDRSLISESALDSLKKELADLEAEHPDLVTPDSPTQRVGGAPLQKFAKVVHRDAHGREARMLSLNDAFSESDVRAWLERLDNYLGRPAPREFYCDLKMDGLAVELVYQDGVFAQGSTRGDGLVGEDVTQNLRTVEAIPLRLAGPRVPSRVVLRGEVVLTKKEFARINREQEKRGGKTYANPRNVAAGSIRQLDPAVAAKRKLDFIAWTIVGSDPAFLRNYPARDRMYRALRDFGFKTSAEGAVVRGTRGIFAFHEKVRQERSKLPYEIDGIVVSINDSAAYFAAGVVGKAPRGGIAYKFSPKEATTLVLDIKVQVGRTGVLTPVAVMRPVGVGGVTVTHATLHNADEIERLGLKIGDTVIVSRAGDVIPQVTKVLTEFRTGKEKPFHMPARCPVDGSKVVRDAVQGGTQGVAYRCSSKTCGAKRREELYHFVSRPAFNIEGLGPKIIDRFLDEGLISGAADIFHLKEGDIAALPRFGEKSAGNIVREIEAKRFILLPRFLYALGILHVGEETANLLAQVISKSKSQISRPGDVLRVLRAMTLEQLQEIPDVGPAVAASIFGWFHNARNARFVEDLDRARVKILMKRAPAGAQKLSGKTFVLTGTLESLSREAAKERIRALGGNVSESVSAKTDFVVAGTEPGSKYEKAKRLGVRIMDEAEFLRMIS
jgi:DNA ligase (NAD+)